MRKRLIGIFLAVLCLALAGFTAGCFGPAEEHDYVPTVHEATCTDEGYTEYTCSRCQDHYTGATIPALGHDMQVVKTVSPTCEHGGYTDYACSRCDHTERKNVTAALSHAFTDKVKDTAYLKTAADCVSDAVYYYACVNCGEKGTATWTDTDSKLGHDLQVKEVVSATCKAGGYTVYECSRCDHTENGSETAIDPTAHSYEKTTVLPTQSSDGFDKHVCKYCGDTYTDNYIPHSIQTFTMEKDVNYSDYSAGIDKSRLYENGTGTLGADPAILYISDETSTQYGYYYLYATGFKAWRSKDLVSWKSMGTVYTFDSDHWEGSDNWAPETVYDPDADPADYGLTAPKNGKGVYFFIYSATPKANLQYTKVSGDSYTGYYHQTGLAVATTPEGPFVMWTGKELGATVNGVDYGTEAGFATYTSSANTGSVRARKGDKVNAIDPWLNYAACRAALKKLYQDGKLAYDISTEYFSTIDSSPFIDHDGTKYMIVRFWNHLNNGKPDNDGNTIYPSTYNCIIKTLNNDWAQLDYSTLSVMNRSFYSFVSKADAAEYNRQAAAYNEKAYVAGVKETKTYEMGLSDVEQYISWRAGRKGVWNEGVQLYYNPDNGLYYMSVSVGSNGTGDSDYSVIQAVAYNVMGPYRKLSIVEGGLLSTIGGGLTIDTGETSEISAPGHHFFIKAGDELLIAYHRHIYPHMERLGDSPRATQMARIEWVKNNDGLTVMHMNGPMTSAQPLFYGTGATKYDNIAAGATVTVSGTGNENVSALTDRVMLVHNIEDAWASKYNTGNAKSYIKEFETTEKSFTITLDFGAYRKISTILIYNSKYESRAFRKVDKIQCYFKADGKAGVFEINDLTYNMNAYTLNRNNWMQPCSAAIAGFADAWVNRIVLTFNNPNDVLALNEIVVLGDPNAIDEQEATGLLSSDYSLKKYGQDGFDSEIREGMRLDGVLTDEEWDGVNVYRTAVDPVNTTTGKTLPTVSVETAVKFLEEGIAVYFKVLGVPAWENPKGLTSSSCVELYLASGDITSASQYYELHFAANGGFELRAPVNGAFVGRANEMSYGARIVGGTINDGVNAGFIGEAYIPFADFAEGTVTSVLFCPVMICQYSCEDADVDGAHRLRTGLPGITKTTSGSTAMRFTKDGCPNWADRTVSGITGGTEMELSFTGGYAYAKTPLTDASVYLKQKNVEGTHRIATTTDKDGKVKVSLPNGTYLLSVNGGEAVEVKVTGGVAGKTSFHFGKDVNALIKSKANNVVLSDEDSEDGFTLTNTGVPTDSYTGNVVTFNFDKSGKYYVFEFTMEAGDGRYFQFGLNSDTAANFKFQNTTLVLMSNGVNMGYGSNATISTVGSGKQHVAVVMDKTTGEVRFFNADTGTEFAYSGATPTFGKAIDFFSISLRGNDKLTYTVSYAIENVKLFDGTFGDARAAEYLK